ncbi:MAG TPA: hypothetical protein PKD54_13800 [Pirellulaceae bacterium]|nr:hypothetical protein [Pirellulaceae bacterium]
MRCPRCGWPEPEKSKETDPNRFSYSLSSLLLVTTLIAICLSVFVALPGLGVMLAILALPPLIRTALVVNKRRANALGTETHQVVAMFFSSMFVTIVTFLAVSITAFGTFCGLCFVSSGVVNINNNLVMLCIAGCSLLSAMGVLIASSFWFRQRWRRDTQGPRK